MPHLSPMSWLSALLTFWLVCFVITSTSWWNSEQKFSAAGLTHAHSSSPSWPW